MSTHIIHRVQGDLAPPVNFELVDQDITGWIIQLQGTYRDTFQTIDIAHTVDVAADGKGHFDWGATDLIRGVADWEIFFTPAGGSPKTFTIPAENSLLLQVRGKKEPGPGVLSGGGDQITIDQDGRTLKIFGGGGGVVGVVLFTTETSLLASALADGTIAYAQDVDRFYKRAAGIWEHLGVVTFPTEAALLAAVPSDGTIAYAIDTDVFFFRTAGAWVAFGASTFSDPYTPPTGTFTVLGKITVPGAGGANTEEFGAAANASGSEATALGAGAVASNTRGVSVGRQASTSGSSTVAVGRLATASGNQDTSIGEQAVASGGLSLAAGQNADATGIAASAVGQNAQATAIGASAFGQNSVAGGVDTVALGRLTIANGLESIAIGKNATTGTFTRAIAIGRGATAIANNDGQWGSAAFPVDLRVHGRFGANGSTPQAATSVTGSRGGNAALASLLTALAAAGLITDNTTA